MSSTGWSASQMAAAYAVVLVVFGVLDGLWLGWLAKDLYRQEMGDLMAASPRLLPAALFYLAFPMAIVYFGLAPQQADAGAGVATAFVRCALLGLVAYATYDLTNMSVIRNFSIKLGMIDIAWGTFASGVSGAAAWAALRWWATRA